MANKRMFSIQIVESDQFLDLPASTQLLYFHLGMNSDDEGFVNSPKRIMRLVGCSEEDLNTLIENKFLIKFDSGVVAIKHWRINNNIRTDRSKQTAYTEERKCLIIKENGAYSFVGIPNDNQVTTNNQNDGCVDKHRLDKNRLGKNRLDKHQYSAEAVEKPVENFPQVEPDSVTKILSEKQIDSLFERCTDVTEMLNLFDYIDRNRDLSAIEHPFEYILAVARKEGIIDGG